MTCSKGWAARCPRATGKKCRCKCGGANHGRHWTDQQITIEAPRARFAILEVTRERLLIEDVGPHDRHPTVTNDAARVVEMLAGGIPVGPNRALAGLLQNRRLYYVDSSGNVDEILHQGGRFVGFRTGADPNDTETP